MFGKRKREGEDYGLHWEDVDDIYYLKRILEKQNEILNTLKSVMIISSNILVKNTSQEKEN